MGERAAQNELVLKTLGKVRLQRNESERHYEEEEEKEEEEGEEDILLRV